MSTKTQEMELLKKLTVAMTENPRATTGALAQAAGISRATLNRFCGSRENLMRMITEQAQAALDAIIQIARSTEEPAESALHKLICAHLENQEYLVFVCGTHSTLEDEIWNGYLEAVDTFIGNGQSSGTFRTDIPAQALAELFVSMICGVIDAGRRDRFCMVDAVETAAAFFLKGAAGK